MEHRDHTLALARLAGWCGLHCRRVAPETRRVAVANNFGGSLPRFRNVIQDARYGRELSAADTQALLDLCMTLCRLFHIPPDDPVWSWRRTVSRGLALAATG